MFFGLLIKKPASYAFARSFPTILGFAIRPTTTTPTKAIARKEEGSGTVV